MHMGAMETHNEISKRNPANLIVIIRILNPQMSKTKPSRFFLPPRREHDGGLENRFRIDEVTPPNTRNRSGAVVT